MQSMRVIHLTDVHLTSLAGCRLRDLRGKRWSGYLSWTRRRQPRHSRDALERLVASVRAEAADRVLVTGDLVQIGLESEIRTAAEWLAALAPPERVLLVPGNHDVYARDSWPAIRRHWRPWLPPAAGRPQWGYPHVHEACDVMLVGASSACVTPIFSARGALGRDQFQRLATCLHAARDAGRPAVLVIHHPPLPQMAHWRKALREAGALAPLLAETRPAFAVCGHLHHNESWTHSGVRVFATAPASSLDQASYRVFDFERSAGRWRVSMQLKVLQPASSGFRVTDELHWALAG